MSKNDGGPAFPMSSEVVRHQIALIEMIPDGDSKDRVSEALAVAMLGLTKRDYMATAALAAMISKDDKDPRHRGAMGVSKLAAFAYEYADAMIKART